jgi:hypothetical protein
MAGNVEQLLLYFPIIIIGIGVLIMLGMYAKDHWHAVLNWTSELKKIKTAKSKRPTKMLGKRIEEKQKINYKTEVGKILEEKNTIKSMDRLLILINQYFAQILGMQQAFTYEELIKEFEKKEKTNLKEFCEALLRIEFSKNEISREELEGIANEFLEITKTHIFRFELYKPGFIKRIKIFNRLSRFKKELQRELEKKKTIQDKVSKVIEKTTEAVWGPVKGYFSPVSIPKKVSFNKVLSDVKQNKQEKSFKSLFDEEQPTLEGFFYFIYLTLRKGIKENKKINEINGVIIQGRKLLSEKKDVIQAETLYYSLIPICNSLSDKNKRKTFKKIVLFYEDIQNAVNLQKAVRYLLQMKLALKSKQTIKAKQAYLEVSKIYEQLPSHYKNEIYEQFLDLEKELNINNLSGK